MSNYFGRVTSQVGAEKAIDVVMNSGVGMNLSFYKILGVEGDGPPATKITMRYAPNMHKGANPVVIELTFHRQ